MTRQNYSIGNCWRCQGAPWPWFTSMSSVTIYTANSAFILGVSLPTRSDTAVEPWIGRAELQPQWASGSTLCHQVVRAVVGLDLGRAADVWSHRNAGNTQLILPQKHIVQNNGHYALLISINALYHTSKGSGSNPGLARSFFFPSIQHRFGANPAPKWYRIKSPRV
jgi:hypothetical protein